MAQSRYLGGLDAVKRAELEHRLWSRLSGQCFICDKPIDLVLHKGQLDVDHIDPLAEEGLDAENNFAITHASCNRRKGAANLEIASQLSNSLLGAPRGDPSAQSSAFTSAFRPASARTNPLGIKGRGEAGCAGALPSVMNALIDALAGHGIRHIDMPAAPERV
jgi:hypothetical protein